MESEMKKEGRNRESVIASVLFAGIVVGLIAMAVYVIKGQETVLRVYESDEE